MPLSGNQRSYLRGLAHHRSAIVQVGHQGATEAVVRALDQALEDHELVKVRLAQAVEDRDAAALALAEGSRAELVQTLGRTALFYRPREKKPEIVLPKPRRAQPTAAKATAQVGASPDADGTES